jgi:hypothetical protein
LRSWELILNLLCSLSDLKDQSLFFDRRKAPSPGEGLRVDPEQRFFIPPFKVGLAFDPSGSTELAEVSGRECAGKWVK